VKWVEPSRLHNFDGIYPILTVDVMAKIVAPHTPGLWHTTLLQPPLDTSC